jgi:hypothetical protein
MESLPEPQPAAPASGSTPEGIFDRLRDHPEWDEARREGEFGRLVAGFPPDVLLAAARTRLGDLSGGDGEAVLRIVESFGSREDFEALADAVAAQPSLMPERAWEALSLLEGAGILEDRPELAERWDEISEIAGSEDSLGELAEQIEGDPDGVWIALEGLGSVEPEVRVEIVAGLADQPTGPGLVTFLRHLAFGRDAATRDAALDALEDRDDSDASLLEAWSLIATRHDDPAVVERARRWLGRHGAGEGELAAGLPARAERPGVSWSLVTSLDHRGRGMISIASAGRDESVAVAFSCDVNAGITDVVGLTTPGREGIEEFAAEQAGRGDRDIVEDRHELALRLLSGCLLISGPRTPPVLPFWLEQALGGGLAPGPFASDLTEVEASAIGPEELAGHAGAVLEACPDWRDDSVLAYELAEEALLRGDREPADPGACRFLFERRLRGCLETYRRMLLWMASFWEAAEQPGLGRSALLLATQLADPQYAVPGHPFLAEIAARSLRTAAADLWRGIDPRRRGGNGGGTSLG